VLAEKMTSITSTVKDKFKRPNIKPLAERNRTTVGLVGIAIVVALVAAVFSYEKIPFLTGKSGYSAYFTEAGGIKPDSDRR
jgi:phospholipid/cholesterol/gamma-HCH transport system substrate-binding protein